ncbi:MAG: DUF3109 family protein [Tannerella sp.]|jgi:hypothetical protein|nr:DUF3109 family protein [Tannerella sp.]
MIEIGDTVLSLDLIERYFCCNLRKCRGACCIEGESGAPLTRQEFDYLQKMLPLLWGDLSPEAKEVINKQGIAYIDRENDVVTSIINGNDCVFACHDENDICRCAVEKAYNEGRIDFRKPVSCHLYPVRVTQYRNYKAVNYHCWKICRAAEILGEQKQIFLYQFLKEAFIRAFGEEWYHALDACAKEYWRRKGK